ncbi:MAG TPA: 1-deoxy-D-xylulose-5-phosphate synthase N-terminal domain-containing protein [Anaerolineales bacterium]|nr:1-deoxy-D-xylulose-5-phosphate synthase N-terminal domain-containing protein [Anaerolineales bacterium]
MTASPSPTATWQTEATRVAAGIRRRVLEHVLRHNGGYMSQACSSAELFAALYTRIMKLGPSIAPAVPLPFAGVPSATNPHAFTGAGYNGPKAPDLDRFIFSPAHYALVLYATLIETGRMAAEGLAQFNQDGSTVEMIGAEHSPGCEVTSGSLGQAISQAAGIALARKRRGETGRTWVMLTDGEFQEGQTWEAFEVLSAYKLDRVGVYVDVNGQQCDGRMEDVLNIEPIAEKLAAFGARVVSVDGHDLDALAAPAELEPDGRPLVVLAYTDPCRCLEPMRARAPKLHYLRFTSPDERAVYQAFYETLLTGTKE